MRGAVSLLGGALLFAGATKAPAQSTFPTLSVGVAVPLGHYAAHRTLGPLVRAGLVLGGDKRHVRLKLEAEGAWMLDRTDNPTVGFSTEGTLRVLGVLATVTAGQRGREGLYVLLGLGPQWVDAAGALSPSPYGKVPGVRAGIGARAVLGGVDWHAELALHAVLSDYATGQEYTTGSYMPIVVGMRF